MDGPVVAPRERLRFPRRVDIREVWASEPADFTPWLAGNLHVLGDLELGELELVDVEMAIPGTGRALDVLARTKTGELIAIENQFGSADHDHLTRGLAYAVGLDARALVVIAEHHRGEFHAVASYMNRIAEQAEDGIGVFLVKVEVEAIEEYLIPRFHVVEGPNEWLHDVAVVKPSSGLGSAEAFIAATTPDARHTFGAILTWWLQQPTGSARFRSQSSASLDRSHPTQPGRPLSHMLLNIDGTFTVQRGYLLDAGVVTENDVESFDEMVISELPALTWTAKRYYLNSAEPPTLGGVQKYWQWLIDHPPMGCPVAD